jgi:hypothetical protein
MKHEIKNTMYGETWNKTYVKTRSKDGSKRMCGVRCYENATLLRPVRKLTIPPSERHFAYYPLANEVAMGYSNATIRHSVRLSVRPSFRRSFPNILVNTLESTSFNGFWPHLVHTTLILQQGQRKAWRIPSPTNLTLWPWPLTYDLANQKGSRLS